MRESEQRVLLPVFDTAVERDDRSANGATSAVDFSVANANAVAQTYAGDSALPLLAGPAFVTSSIFDWGLPFFYGRNVYAAIEQQATPSGVGPYVAY